MKNRRIYNNKSNLKKEKAVMIASTVLVLTALTVTGVYVRNGNRQEKDDGYTLDFSALEGEGEEAEADDNLAADNDLDVDPDSLEADSGKVENIYGIGKGVSPKEDLTETARAGEETGIAGILPDKDDPTENIAAEASAGTESEQTDTAEAMSQEAVPELHFAETDSLLMPISGNILLDYSMDHSIYFQTLQQYRYNPAVLIGAEPGTMVKAAASGRVLSVSQQSATGTTVVMELGDGYEVTYGQLKDVTVAEGTYVKQGDTFAAVADPTKYYSVEGANLYLMLTRDGTAVDPIAEE